MALELPSRDIDLLADYQMLLKSLTKDCWIGLIVKLEFYYLSFFAW